MKWNLKTARCYLMFFLEKKDGNQRMNLNLKHLKQNTEEIHFKMDTLKIAVTLMKQDCIFVLKDWKDASLFSEDTLRV